MECGVASVQVVFVPERVMLSSKDSRAVSRRAKVCRAVAWPSLARFPGVQAPARTIDIEYRDTSLPTILCKRPVEVLRISVDVWIIKTAVNRGVGKH